MGGQSDDLHGRQKAMKKMETELKDIQKQTKKKEKKIKEKEEKAEKKMQKKLEKLADKTEKKELKLKKKLAEQTTYAEDENLGNLVVRRVEDPEKIKEQIASLESKLKDLNAEIKEHRKYMMKHLGNDDDV